ncbi:SDR family NAD(P)-dependent oxidoreductase [Paludifilum halophilum]|uniref:Oxidoreductase n=1 Tax=Paludifilum halophilum TaxID=1642702 RepID=A0A235BBM5_9BACL|nr:SDR family oxidoreductase [Paludifilum halophilum]OYD08975.1 oxidoreductase [Paludifilum halophilum]
MDLQLRDQRVLVTGSTKGIGKETARAFLKEGARVVISGRRPDTVDRVVEELAPLGEVTGMAADLSTTEGADDLVRRVDEAGELDVLVNNAGFFEVKEFEEVTDEEWLSYFQANVMSAVRLSRHYLPRMLERNSGRILHIASEAGIKPLPQMIPYSVTKTALITLARGMAERTKGTRVTVNSILPGPTWTEGVESFIKQSAEAEGKDLDAFTADYFREMEPTSLIQRFATVEEVADTILFLSSPKTSAINGATQRVEGGIIRSI